MTSADPPNMSGFIEKPIHISVGGLYKDVQVWEL